MENMNVAILDMMRQYWFNVLIHTNYYKNQATLRMDKWICVGAKRIPSEGLALLAQGWKQFINFKTLNLIYFSSDLFQFRLICSKKTDKN